MQMLAQNYIALKQYQTELLKEYGGYSKVLDTNLTFKLRKIHEILKQLQYILAMEKQQLEKERYETHSMYSLQRAPSMVYQQSKCNLQYPDSCYPVDWRSYVVTPNYDYEYYPEPYPKPIYVPNHIQAPQDPRTYGLYKGHLEDVERMCNEELHNMENSISNLKKIRRDWNCYEVNGTPENGSRRIKRRIHRRRTYYYGDCG